MFRVLIFSVLALAVAAGAARAFLLIGPTGVASAAGCASVLASDNALVSGSGVFACQ